jgi:3-oxoacyl-[acyl-carrier-protein] synthase-3
MNTFRGPAQEFAAIRAVEYYLPERTLTNDDLAADFPGWTAEKIAAKTGISERRIAAPAECSSDLAVGAARQLFGTGVCKPEDIDFLLFCTQSSDYFLPTTACLLQERLGLPANSGALDFNLGCSGYVYGLALAKGLIETGQSRNLLLITAETYSKFMHPSDRGARTLFGDAAAATLVSAVGGEAPLLGPVVLGTDGRGAGNLIVRAGGMRHRSADPSDTTNYLHMNGPEIFSFASSAVPAAVHEVLRRAGKCINDVDLFVFHQANEYMLEHLRRKLKIEPERFYLALRQYGNTVSSTIPIALYDARRKGKLHAGDLVMVVGFGVGYSWGAALVRWI